MVIPGFFCTNSWMDCWLNASWNVDPEPFSVAGASLTVVVVPPPLAVVLEPEELLLELPQAASSSASPTTPAPASSRERRREKTVIQASWCRNRAGETNPTANGRNVGCPFG